MMVNRRFVKNFHQERSISIMINSAKWGSIEISQTVCIFSTLNMLSDRALTD
jgi:hypothetical protein